MKSASLFAALIFAVTIGATGTALAQEQDPRNVSLVLEDESSDCSNANVSADPSNTTGTIGVFRRPVDRTVVIIDLKARPNTTYHVFLKCVRLLGDLTTRADGSGTTSFEFQTSLVGNIFAFDVYPEGAPPTDRHQSTQVNYRDPAPVVVASPRMQYLSQSSTGISIAFAEMPLSTEIVLVNATSGAETGAPPLALSQGGAGRTEITIPSHAPGAYYLLARSQADKRYIAQTVAFYLN